MEEEVRSCFTLNENEERNCDSGGFWLCEGCAKLMPENVRLAGGYPKDYYLKVVDDEIKYFYVLRKDLL